MTRQPHDQFAKSLLSEVLSPCGSVEISREVSDDTRAIDLYFHPNPQQDPSPLGLLGRMAQTPCLLEPYCNPVSVSQIRACLLKTLILTAQQERSSPSDHPPLALRVLELLLNWKIMLDEKQEALKVEEGVGYELITCLLEVEGRDPPGRDPD